MTWGDASSPGKILRLLGIFTLAIFPVWTAFFGLRLLFNLGRNWRRLVFGQRHLAIITVALGASLKAFIFSPYGRLILRWFMD